MPGNPDYRVIRIPKKSGGVRVIHAPLPALKTKQESLLKILSGLRIRRGPWVNAYLPRTRGSIKTAAERLLLSVDGKTRSPDCLLKMDIADYFSNCTEDLVIKALEYESVEQWIIDLVRDRCFIFDGKGRRVLPQGAPTSPFLAALVMKGVAARINGVVKEWDRLNHCPCTFTTYSDNLSFGCDDPSMVRLVYPVRHVLKKIGFEVNPKKIEFHRKPARFVVCGVQINDKIGPRRPYWRVLRAELHNALTDRRADIAPAGFYLEDKTRQELRRIAGINGKPGLVKALPQDALNFLARNQACTRAIPWATWKGKIGFVAFLDPKRGRDLQAIYDELEAETRCKSARSSSTPTRP